MVEPNPRWTSTGHWTTPYYGYVESLEQAEAALTSFKIETQSMFVVYQKDKTFGAQGKSIYNIVDGSVS